MVKKALIAIAERARRCLESRVLKSREHSEAAGRRCPAAEAAPDLLGQIRSIRAIYAR
jgi:hypothetical protein